MSDKKRKTSPIEDAEEFIDNKFTPWFTGDSASGRLAMNGFVTVALTILIIGGGDVLAKGWNKSMVKKEFDKVASIQILPESWSKRRAKNLEAKQSKETLEAARAEYIRIGIEACEGTANSRYELIECIQRLKQ